MGRRLRDVSVAAALCAVAASGCGGGGATRFSGEGPLGPGGGGRLVFAIPADPGTIDPLHASDASAALVARQVFEPLVARVAAPYGRRGSPAGLALRWRHSGDFRVWSFRLRDGVKFQDATPLDADAVVANADRWRSDPAGRLALPGLIAADAPSPDTVRFILRRVARRLPAEMRDPRLGLISPAVLESSPAGRLARSGEAGTGPFELRRDGAATLLRRNPAWWGSPLGLGPALDELLFRPVPSPAARVSLLRAGEVRVAAGLNPDEVAALRDDPLIAAISGQGADGIAFERSVRGIETWRPASLSGAWLALLGQGG